jgi:hypothetical protein
MASFILEGWVNPIIYMGFLISCFFNINASSTVATAKESTFSSIVLAMGTAP